MRKYFLSLILVGCLGAFSAAAQLVLDNGADIDMTGSVGSQIIFPDGTTIGSASEVSIPDGHGGTNNTVSGTNAYVGGGGYNVATGSASVVSGGWSNSATEPYSAVGGGEFNVTTGDHAVVGGGKFNQANADFATVGGGGATAGGYGNAVTDD